MAFKQFEVADIGTVTVYKRRGASSLRLSIRAAGDIRVTVPAWSTYYAGVQFAKTKQDWILQHQKPAPAPLNHGQQIGKAHRLIVEVDASLAKPTTRIRQSDIIISHPPQATAAQIQKAVSTASIRALKVEAQKLLPIRLKELAEKHGFTYGTVYVKQLKTRWGSCDQHGNITLNLFLMQLPWHLIDYVLLHELTHTRHMHHGPDFWAEMTAHDSRSKLLRIAIKQHQPVLQAQNI